MRLTHVVYYLNDNIVEVVLKDPTKSGDQAYINSGATVQIIEVVDKDGNQVTGTDVAWPLAMTYVAASDGLYRATLVDTMDVVPGREYEAVVEADAGAGLKLHQTVEFEMRERKG